MIIQSPNMYLKGSMDFRHSNSTIARFNLEQETHTHTLYGWFELFTKAYPVVHNAHTRIGTHSRIYILIVLISSNSHCQISHLQISHAKSSDLQNIDLLYLWHLLSQLNQKPGLRTQRNLPIIPKDPQRNTCNMQLVFLFCVQLVDICMISYIHTHTHLLYAYKCVYIYIYTYIHIHWCVYIHTYHIILPDALASELSQKKSKHRGPTVRLLQRGDFSAFHFRVNPDEFTWMLFLFHRCWRILFSNQVPSGKLLDNHGESPFLLGKEITINGSFQ